MVQTQNNTDNYQGYIRSVLRLYALMDSGLFENDEADALREEMVEPWYALSLEERKRMDGLVMDLSELRESRKKSPPKELTESHGQEGLLRIREVSELKEAGRFDEALGLLREWQGIIASHLVWQLRGSCWKTMGVPEVAAEFYREATRLDHEKNAQTGKHKETS